MPYVLRLMSLRLETYNYSLSTFGHLFAFADDIAATIFFFYRLNPVNSLGILLAILRIEESKIQVRWATFNIEF